jgi:hypothetical protein
MERRALAVERVGIPRAVHDSRPFWHDLAADYYPLQRVTDATPINSTDTAQLISYKLNAFKFHIDLSKWNDLSSNN